MTQAPSPTHNKPQRLFGFKTLLKKTWETYRKNWKKLTLTVLTAFATAALLGFGMAIVIFLVKQISMEINKMVGMTLIAFILIAGIIAISVIMNAILYYSAIQAVKEDTVSIKKTFGIAFKKFWGMLSVMLRTMVYAWGWFIATLIIALTIFAIINTIKEPLEPLAQNNLYASVLINPSMPNMVTDQGTSDLVIIRNFVNKNFILTTLTFIFGIITFFLGGYRTIRAHFSLQALLESNKTPKEALETSKQVTKKNFWRILGYYGLLSMIPTLLLIIVIIVINILISSQATEEIIGGIAQFIFSMIMTSFVAIWRYLFFKDLEQEKNLAIQTPSA